MFFLGHMAWAYVWGVSFDRRRWGRLFIPAVLVLALLPDMDLFLWEYGVEHHSFTHSLVFWLILFVPFLAVYGGRVIPYFLAVVQHFAFGDFLVGDVMLFWPFSHSYFGFNTVMMSIFDIGLETGGLLLALGIMYFNGDLKRLLSVDKNNVWMFFPFLALVASMMFFAVDLPIIPLIYHIGYSKLFATIVFVHLVLAVLLFVSALQGLRDLP
ncbi:MAG: metal-dependent hydrolase [Candidatus Bathyarchaeota archaeon]|nr:metal-dependent hydrolase [Candidatus Bathyarchaeota archaeon]